MKMNGAKMVIEALHNENVKTVFGYPGGAILNVYDEIYKQTYFKHILTRHEQAAIEAAEGYARATGKVGVSIVTSGPGFTNAITGIANAYMDSIPMVVISGQVPSTLIGTDAFQEIDAVGISRPCTKHNYLVNNIKDLPRIIKEAFYIAKTGRPGPVHIDLPKDITAQIGTFTYPKEINMPTYKPTISCNKKQLKRAINAIEKSKKPILYVGGGAILSNSSFEIRELAKKLNIPAVETLMARGVMDDKNPLFFGMLGMHGEYSANMGIYESDLIIALGARFDDRVTGRLDEFGKKAKIIHIDVDPASIAKIINPDYPIVGDLKHTLNEILNAISSDEYNFDNHNDWINILNNYRKKEPLKYYDNTEKLKPQWVIQETGKKLGNKAIVTTDVGQHQMWTAQFFPFSQPRQYITSGGLGTMGYGLPAALGVAQALKEENKGRITINFTGDGSILMNIQELMTCTQSELPVINILLNNNYLGMVRQWQTMFYENRLSQTDLTVQPDFTLLAKSFGCNGYKVKTKEEFRNALDDAVLKNKVALIEVIVDRNENVLPIVPNGHSLNEMVLLKGEANE